MKKIAALILTIALCGAVYGASNAKGLKQAKITAVVNDVSITSSANVAKPAKVKDIVAGKTSLNTGLQSRAELIFDDKTLARIGSNAHFSFEEGTRNMDLKKGAMLLQVPKGAGGATVRTAAVTAAITGTTILVSHQPNQSIKVIVLEGTLKFYLNGKKDEFITIHAGQMIYMHPDAKNLPTPVNVDLKKLTSTSALVNGFENTHLDMTLIYQQIAQQQDDIKNSKLVFLDKEQDMMMDATELMSAVDQAVNANRRTTTPDQTTRGSSGGGGGNESYNMIKGN